MVLYYARSSGDSDGLTMENIEETFESLQDKASSFWDEMSENEKILVVAIGIGIAALLIMR